MIGCPNKGASILEYGSKGTGEVEARESVIIFSYTSSWRTAWATYDPISEKLIWIYKYRCNDVDIDVDIDMSVYIHI